MAASSVISDPKQAARELKRLFSEHERAVFFGGAGVSTASGIPDFRSVDGLYHQQFAYPPETHALAFVLREPSRGVLRLLPQKDDRPGRQAQPRAHEARRAGGRGQARCRCDPEHRRAAPDGRSNVVWELHGSVHRNICQRCGATYDAAWICAREHEDALSQSSRCAPHAAVASSPTWCSTRSRSTPVCSREPSTPSRMRTCS